MRSPLFVAALLILCCFSDLEAQTDVKISRKEFKNDRSGYEAAWQNVVNGDAFFKEGGTSYGNAFEEYQKAAQYNDINPALNYKAGVAALYSDNKEKAFDFFSKVLEENPDITDDVLYFTGRALQYAGKFDEAAGKLTAFIETPGKKNEDLVKSAERHIEECKAAIDLIADTLRVEINNLGSGINSNADEYAELLVPDGKTIFFASRRLISKSGTKYDDSGYDENILISSLINEEWGMPVPAGKKLQSKYCETPLYLSPSGEELYIYAGYENEGDIRVSKWKNGEWKTPEPVKFNINTGGTETSMTMTPSGEEVWFVSDQGKKGSGGKDIYSIKRIDGNKWSKPVNAGPGINTSLDEESLRFSAGGDTLYFSSGGHSSMGGFDIFYSVKDSSGKWSEAINFGYPVNTPWDELFYFKPASAGKLFYFASNRPESIGGLDIFTGRFIEEEPVIIQDTAIITPEPEPVVLRDTVLILREAVPEAPPPPPVIITPAETVIFLTGKVNDSETNEPVLSKIDIIDLASDTVVATTASSDVDGSYRVKLPEKKSYMVEVRGTGFLSDMRRVDVPPALKEESINLDIALIRVKVGKKVVLNNILFETGKSVLTRSSGAELDRLYNILEDNKMMRIEISGHTDKTGSEPVNFRLSGERAKAVLDYLVAKGIEATRLESRGYGSLQPVADNATAEGRSKNRRVEFKILEF